MVKQIGNSSVSEKTKTLFDRYHETKVVAKQEEMARIEDAKPIIVDSKHDGLVKELQNKHFWKEVKRSLTNLEIVYFQNEWANYCSQFSDVLHTDEIGIKDAIMLEIELNRILIEKKEILDEIEEITSEINAEEKKKKDKDMDLVRDLRRRRNELRGMSAPIQKRYLDTQHKKDERFKALKANREQRLKKSIDTNVNIFELIKEICQAKQRIKINKEISLHGDAVKLERERLMKPHKYLDGSWDSQLLNAETVEYLEGQDVGDSNNSPEEQPPENIMEESLVE